METDIQALSSRRQRPAGCRARWKARTKQLGEQDLQPFQGRGTVFNLKGRPSSKITKEGTLKRSDPRRKYGRETRRKTLCKPPDGVTAGPSEKPRNVQKSSGPSKQKKATARAVKKNNRESGIEKRQGIEIQREKKNKGKSDASGVR